MESSSGGDSGLSSVMSNVNSKRKAEMADTAVTSPPSKKVKLSDGGQGSISITLPVKDDATFGPGRAEDDGGSGTGRSVLSWNKSWSRGVPAGLSVKQLGGVAASVLGVSPTSSSGSQAANPQNQRKEFMDLPHAVLQMTATGLQCDLIVAGLLQSQGLLETVLCVPRDLISVSLRMSKGLLAKNTCEVRQPRL